MEYISLEEETKKLDAAIKDGSFPCIDVYGPDIKRYQRDWLTRKAHEMLGNGKNVLKAGFIESGASQDSTKLKFVTLYFVGFDSMRRPGFVERKPAGFVYTGTYKDICPVRNNGYRKEGTIEVIKYKGSLCIIADNQKDFDIAMDKTKGTERKVVQVHTSYSFVPLSSFDAVKLVPEGSNLVIVHTDSKIKFKGFDEHIYGSIENHLERKETLDVMRNSHKNAGELMTLEGFDKQKVKELGVKGFYDCMRFFDADDVNQKVFVVPDNVKLMAKDSGNDIVFDKTDVPGLYLCKRSTIVSPTPLSEAEPDLVTLDPEKMGELLGLKCVPVKEKEFDLSDLSKKVSLEASKGKGR